MKSIETFVANLKHAAFNGETVEIGGGEFGPDVLRAVVAALNVVAIQPAYVMKKDDSLIIRSMGKNLRVSAIFTDNKQANAYMEKHDEEACIAAFGPFVFLANKYSPGE